jgi:glycosyltransferase involved in cell wall biosynthesis
MKIAFIGSRGIPANYGGFETFVEEVAVGLSKNYNFDVMVVGDTHQKEQLNSITEYKGVKIIYSRYSKAEQTIRFYFDSMLKAWNSDIIYSCGVGNAFFLFIPFFLGKKFVTNPDGIGWKRLKWSKTGKKILGFMFYLSAKLSPYIVADSLGVEKVFREKFNRKNNIKTIEYGAYLNETICDNSGKVKTVLNKYKLVSNEYHLVVSRLEPENNVKKIIEGYIKTKNQYPLIIVGNLQHTIYVKELLKIKNENVYFIGGIYNKYELEVVRSNAFSYFHGHSVGGTNPSLLEAMASKNICICHDNEFNNGVVNDSGFYFKTIQDVSDIIQVIERNDYSHYGNEVFEKVKNYFNWGNIVKLYADYFKEIIK